MRPTTHQPLFRSHGRFRFRHKNLLFPFFRSFSTFPSSNVLLNISNTSTVFSNPREAGVKIIVHDRSQKADPDQDAINISPGVVTYVGVQMMNISRLPAPYPD